MSALTRIGMVAPRPCNAAKVATSVSIVWHLGDRVMFELRTEIGRKHDCLGDVADRISSYSKPLLAPKFPEI